MALEDKSGGVWAAAIIFACLSWLAVGLRIYVRTRQIGKFGIDDTLVIVSQIFFTAYLVCQMGGAAYGTGKHLKHLSTSNAETALRFWFFCEVWYSLATSCVKIAICLSLLRVTVKFVHRCIIYGIIIWSISLGLAFFLGVIFQCIPASDWWSLDPNQKRCLDAHVVTSLLYFVSALNVACDWTLGIFPFFIVKGLAIPLSRKIMVASVLAFGAIGSTATLVRMFYVEPLEQIYLGSNGDFLYLTTPVAILSTVEVGVGITAICISTLRPLITKIKHIVKPSEQSTYRHGFPRISRLDSNEAPIPLTDSAIGVPTMNADGTLRVRDPYAGVSVFNGTRPLDASFSEAGDHHGKHSPPPDNYADLTHFNTTKALSSSYSDAEDDYYDHNPGPTHRRQAPG